jgi:formate/nitrite transporter FocA (FNT family)
MHVPETEHKPGTDSAGPSDDLSQSDKRSVDDRSSGSAKVVHGVVRLQGDEELDRPVQSLFFSGFAAGMAICASFMAEGYLKARLPDAAWTELVVALGYPVGFVIVILGNLQLFTESTVTAVLPVATHPTIRNFGRLLRLWAVVLAANMAGTFVVAAAIAGQVVVGPKILPASSMSVKPSSDTAL